MKRILLTLVATSALVGAGAAHAGSCGTSSAAHDHDHDHIQAASYGEQKADIVDLAVSAGTFQTLTAALGAAGLVDVLRGDGPFTVFAPTDEAFAKLPKGTVDSLLLPENRDKLVSILTYHVVPGSLDAEEVATRRRISTVNGQTLDVTEKGKAVLLNESQVVKADLLASNGIVHVIDTVLLPN